MLNFIILAHKEPKQVKRLVDSLHTIKTFFYIHISANNNIDPFIEEMKCFTNIYFLKNDKRVSVTWGGVELVYATLNALKQIIEDNRTGHCILISGQDYPVKSKSYIENFFQSNVNINYIQTFELPNDIWFERGLNRLKKYKINTSSNRGSFVLIPSIFEKEFYCRHNLKSVKSLLVNKKFLFLFKIIRKRKHPDWIKPYGGSEWWSLTTNLVKEIIAYLEANPKFLKYHKYTLVPDEIVFQTVVMAIYRGRTKREVKKFITYTNWCKPNVSLPVTFTINDIEELSKLPEDILFARKFDVAIDENILNHLDEHVLTGITNMKQN